jgi:hypothetical protein
MNSRALGLLVAIFVFALIASADPVNVITVGPGSTLIGFATISSTFTLPSVSGVMNEWVVSDTTNPYYSSALDFIFQVTDSTGSLQEFAMTSCCFDLFNAGITSGYGVAGTETPSSIIGVTGLDGTSGPGFIFGSGMTVGTSVDLIIQTDTSYLDTAFFQVDGVTKGFAWGPLPEPKYIGLVLGGFFALGLLLMRQFRTQ